MFIKELLVGGQLLFALTACDKNDDAMVLPEPVPVAEYNIYPVPAAGTSNGYTGWVGDVMPHYAEGKFQLFFLHDATDQEKRASAGEHPIHRFTTNNLTEFTYEGEVIPYGNSRTQDHLVGTGSMVKSGDTYYFYYTGFNSNSSWLQNNNPGWVDGNVREAVMYATSSDLKTWTKKEGFSIKAPEGYARNEFRDPYVFYNEEFSEYWMVISTQRSGRGVLLVYKSNNPAADDWQVHGTLDVEGDYLMLECADIFKWGNQYYMLFAEDWSGTPGTHYRVAGSTEGPWLKPASGMDMFDGHQFYAARMATDGNNYYSFGWAHRRNPETNTGTRTWGGNLISHELVQLNDGSMGVKMPETVEAYFSKAADLSVISQEGTVTQSAANFTIDGSSTAAGVVFDTVGSLQKISGTINLNSLSGTASIGFIVGESNNASYIIRMEPAQNRIAGYNNGAEVTRVPFEFEAGINYSFHLVVENSVVVLYLNNEVALTNRIYNFHTSNWKISADNLKLVLGEMKSYSH